MAAERLRYDPAGLVELNRDTTLFLESLLKVFHRLPRLARYGACHASHGEYFGQVAHWRQRQRERAAECRKANEAATGFSWRSRPRLERWLDWLEHGLAHGMPARLPRFPMWEENFKRHTAPTAFNLGAVAPAK